MPRAYHKKSPYWDAKKQVTTIASSPAVTPYADRAVNELAPAFDGTTHYTAVAACGGGDSNDTYRTQFSPTITSNSYKNIRSGIVPFDGSRDGYWGMGDAIALSMQAYFNVSVIRNAINMAVDFSISDLHIKSVNKTVKRFFTNWFQSIGLSQFMTQFFLEYYRSGNVFIYKFMGRIPEEQFNKLQVAIAAKSPNLPIRYILLNPQQIYLQMGPSYNYTFSKMLSTYEIQRLRSPQTEEDKLVFQSFPKAIQDQIKNYAAQPYLYVPLDINRLSYAFYRKQDYEPLAVPMVFPVLNDVETKLELKKLDLSLVRSMEQAVLHVSTGAPADAHNQPIGKKNIEILQNIFKQQTIGRVLITDWSTKVEWKIPDLKGLLGPEKYERVDADIKEGLQYMFFGEEKFANASIKAKVFIESLKEGRRCLLDNFLRPEVKKVCEAMNFKNVPTLEFEEIDMADQTAMNGIYYKMASLGLLTSDELNGVLKNGVLPDKDASLEHQTEYKAARDKGLYSPVVPPMAPGMGGAGGGGTPSAGAGRPAGIKTPLKSPRKSSPIGTSRASVEIDELTLDGVKAAVNAMNTVRDDVEQALKKRFKLEQLTEAQMQVAEGTAKSIVVNEPMTQWQESVASYVTDFKNMNQDAAIAIDALNAEYPDLDPWSAIAIYLAQTENPR